MEVFKTTVLAEMRELKATSRGVSPVPSAASSNGSTRVAAHRLEIVALKTALAEARLAKASAPVPEDIDPVTGSRRVAPPPPTRSEAGQSLFGFNRVPAPSFTDYRELPLEEREQL